MRIRISKNKWNQIGRFAGWKSMDSVMKNLEEQEKAEQLEFPLSLLNSYEYDEEKMFEIVSGYLIKKHNGTMEWMETDTWQFRDISTNSGKYMSWIISVNPHNQPMEKDKLKIGLLCELFTINEGEDKSEGYVHDGVATFDYSETALDVAKYISNWISTMQSKW